MGSREARQQGAHSVPLGMMRPSGSLMSSVQRRETRVTGGNWRRLSLMHIVVKGSWVRSSLGSMEQGDDSGSGHSEAHT